eukprot:SAG22_NODE_1229_length_5081_cov_2.651947_3_plen_41_part_00
MSETPCHDMTDMCALDVFRTAPKSFISASSLRWTGRNGSG